MFTISSSQRAILQSNGTLIARIFIGALFLVAGYGKLTGIDATAGYIEAAGLPAPLLLTYLTILVEMGGGLLLILGWKFDLAAFSLIIFTALTIVFFHSDFANPMQQSAALKNLSIISGLLYMLAYGPGSGWRVKA